MYNCRNLISSVPFFRDAHPTFVADVVTKLKQEIYQPGDVIVKEGSTGKRMYFLHDGNVEIFNKNLTVVATLGDGSYFGGIYTMYM